MDVATLRRRLTAELAELWSVPGPYLSDRLSGILAEATATEVVTRVLGPELEEPSVVVTVTGQWCPHCGERIS